MGKNVEGNQQLVMAQSGYKSQRYPQTINIKKKAMAKLSEIQATNLLTQNTTPYMNSGQGLRHKST